MKTIEKIGTIEALREAEIALGENLHYIGDALDQKIRQGDAEAKRKMLQLQTAWKHICVALHNAGENGY